MGSFLSGGIAISCLYAALFFFRFRQRTGEHLFSIFGLAFAMLFIERCVLELTDPTAETRPYIYMIRLMAFLIIIYGIVEKNLSQKQGKGSSDQPFRPKLITENETDGQDPEKPFLRM